MKSRLTHAPLVALALLAGALLAGCAAPPREAPVIASDKSAVELRAMQSRLFDTSDRSRTLRGVIATLQDLGYTIDKVDAGSGTVTATKLSALRLSATVMPRGRQIAVRANAQVKLGDRSAEVDDPEFYQRLFFEPLSHGLSLAAAQDRDQVTAAPPLVQTANAAATLSEASAP